MALIILITECINQSSCTKYEISKTQQIMENEELIYQCTTVLSLLYNSNEITSNLNEETRNSPL